MNKQEERALAYIEEHRDDMIRFLRKLVRIDTQVPPGLNYDIICDVLADRLSGLGCKVDVHKAPEKYMDLSGARLMGLEGPRSNARAVRSEISNSAGLGGGSGDFTLKLPVSPSTVTLKSPTVSRVIVCDTVLDS
jgi:acetylornithine deacetylase/succinyl-diaminopimelate desuccinylase-like protein